MFGQVGPGPYGDRLAQEISGLGWEFADAGQRPDAVVVVRIDPLESQLQAGAVPTMYVHMDNVDSSSGDDVTSRLHVTMRRPGDEPVSHRFGPTHVEEAVMSAAMRTFLEFANVSIDEVEERSTLSRALEALLSVIAEAEQLTRDLSDRDAEIEALHEDIEALQQLARSLQRKLTRRRLGLLAQLTLNFGLGLAVNRVDAAVFPQHVQQAIENVEQECRTVINVVVAQSGALTGDGNVLTWGSDAEDVADDPYHDAINAQLRAEYEQRDRGVDSSDSLPPENNEN